MKTSFVYCAWLASATACFGQELGVTIEPQNPTVAPGGSVTFTTQVTGTGPFTYQWQLNGTNLPNIVTTVAGNGAASYSGDGGPATNASVYNPGLVAVDSYGDVFVADTFNHRIREINTNGDIMTVAGNGQSGYTGDNIAATNARLNYPNGVAVDGFGNVFISDCFNQRNRKVGTNGAISTVAGTGSPGYSGDGGAATSASINYPYSVTLDGFGNLYISDFSNQRVRKVDTNGIITTVVGNGTAGYSGDGGLATNASIDHPYDVAVDGLGHLFVADDDNSVIREINTNGVITTVAGNGVPGYSGDGGPATNASMHSPTCTTVDSSGNLWIGDTGNGRVRVVGANGIITTAVGNGVQAYSGDGGPATNASLSSPDGLVFGPVGDLFVADHDNQRIREVAFSSDPSLTVADLTTNDAGNYTVVVSDQTQSVTSSVTMLTVSSTPPPTCTPPAPGLVSWWQGEGNANDSFGTNNGVLVGGATFTTGEVGQAFNFNGTSQYVDVPNSSSLNPTASITCEAWINPRQFTATTAAPIIKKAGENTAQQDGYALQMGDNGNVDFWVYVNGGIGWVGSSEGMAPFNQWSHVAGVYDGTNLSIYVNGALAGTPVRAEGQIVSSGNDLQVGHDPSNPSWYFGGLIDEASVYNTALSAVQILAIYNAGSAGKCDDLPPALTSQPQSETVFTSNTVSFSVTAGGSQPLSYQWFENTTNIPATANATATNATLVLTNVQVGQSGNIYSVLVTNLEGSTNSSNAVLTVLAPGSCFPPPTGLISWWPGERSALDIAGTNNGTLIGGVTFAPGVVGMAFDLNGTSQYVDVPNSSSLNPAGSVTLEAWVYPRQFSPTGSSPIIKKAGEGSAQQDGYSLEIDPGAGAVMSAYTSSAGWVEGTPAPLPLNQWSLVVGVCDGSNLYIYVNGALVGPPVHFPGPIVSSGNDLQIGHDPSNPSRFFTGLIDEPTVYGTALSATQIQAIYDAGSTGKCKEPVIAGQPQNQDGYYGGSVFLTVNATGSGTLSYQWLLNDVAITNATNATLSLGSLQPASAGYYTVIISNMYGVTTSTPALVAVNPPGISLALYPGLTIDGVPGFTYGIQYSTNLSNTNDWLGLANVTLSGTNELYFDLQPATAPQRSYRVVPGPISIP